MITKLSRLAALALAVLAVVTVVVALHSNPARNTALLLHSPVVVVTQSRQSALRSAESDVARASKPAAAQLPKPTPTPARTYTPPVAVPDPGSAQAIAYALLPGYGFSQTTQYACLVSLWNRESGWRVNAEEPTSGAYGIPQSLPASKMAMFGSDYLTNPTTQIKWGLWYIQQAYGTPCNAWYHDYTAGWY